MFGFWKSLDSVMQRAWREDRTTLQMCEVGWIVSSMKTSMGRLHPVRRSMRSETTKLGMSSDVTVVTMPVVSWTYGSLGAKRCADRRIM